MYASNLYVVLLSANMMSKKLIILHIFRLQISFNTFAKEGFKNVPGNLILSMNDDLVVISRILFELYT